MLLSIAQLYFQEKKMQDAVLQKFIFAVIVFTAMQSFHFHTYGAYDSNEEKSFFGVFIRELFACFAVIFTFGPIRVWLDIKRGSTSVRELQDGFEDRQTWMHKQMGIDTNLLPEKNT